MNSIKNFFIQIFSIFILCLVQISILNPILYGWWYIYIYVLFIFIYPYSGNKFIFLFFSFITGCIIDFCMNSGGIHAFSLTFSSFFRLKFIQFFDGKNFINQKNFSTYDLPFLRKILYLFSLISTHHFSLLILEIIKTSHFNNIILLKTVFSSIFTTILCIIYFFFRKIKH